LKNIIKAALKHELRQRKKWQVFLDGKSHYGMYAVETIEAGEIIEAYEEQPHVLVSQTHSRQNWTAAQQQWFSQYAIP